MNVMPETLPPNDEISLLDIAAAIAESWMLLVFGPLIVGLSVLGFVHFVQPDRYASTAILHVSQEEAALLQSATVVDPAIREAGLDSSFDDIAAARRAVLENGLNTERLDGAELLRVTVTAGSPQSANALLTALITELIRNSAPRDDERRALEQKLQALERSVQNMNDSLRRLNALYDRAIDGDSNAMASLGDAGQSYATLISGIAETEEAIVSAQMALEGSVSPSDIVQKPTLEEEALPKRGSLVAALAALATGFVLLIFAFLRAGLANAAKNPQSAENLKRIRNAFGLGKRRAQPGE